MLMDKGYYDYDYKEMEAKVVDVAPKSKEETRKMVSRFGVGVADKSSAEELQKMAMESINE